MKALPKSLRFQSLVLADLPLSGLRPTVPPEIALLTDLHILSLSRNSINATLSDLLPLQLLSLRNLTHLNLYDNNLSGNLPTEIGLMTSLTSLELHWNSFSGSLPTELGGLISLNYMYIAGNAFTGSLPSEIGNRPA